MRAFLYSLLAHAWLSLSYFALQSPAQNSSCKAVPHSPTWPSEQQWAVLNSSLYGRLLAPLPPAAVCDPSLPIYNNATCSYVASQYQLTDFHSKDPISVDLPNWEDDACLPSGPHCNLAKFPRYVVNATTAADVKAAILFAGKWNVRLIVKGTGHDYLGRSASIRRSPRNGH